MKKKLVFLLLVMVVCVVAFAGCSNERFYQRNVSNFDELAVAMGDKMVYPTFDLKYEANESHPEYKGFFLPKMYEGQVSIPQEARANEIILLYIPPLTKEQGKALTDAEEVTYDELAYRYSVKMTLNNADYYGEEFNKGFIEIYVHGTDYTKLADVDTSLKGKVAYVPVSGENSRQAKLDKDNEGDKKSLEKAGEGEYYVSKVEAVNGKDVLFFENKNDGQVIRYFTIGEDYAYEMTACIRVNGDIKDAAAKKEAYDALLAKSKTILDGFVNEMTK